MDVSTPLYTVTFENRPNYLYAFVKGDLARPDTRIECWTHIVKRCRDDGANHLLVVQDSPGNATPTDAFDSSAGIVALGLGGIKIAFVDLDPSHYENNKFGELVAENRGAWAKVFTTEPEGVTWLLKEE